jgi:UDP-N-acetylmuramoyl-L-alanyl-D-glutamate--2,6-diaminopimelate ligase
VLLSRLLDGVHVSKLFEMQYGRMVVTQDLQVHGVQYDSRKVGPGDLFVAIPGNTVDGHTFIDTAIANGAVVVVVQDDAARSDYYFLHANVVKIVVPDSRQALAQIAANYHGHPSQTLRLVGVTGTNGKTTTAYLIRSILEASGGQAGLLGTIEYRFNGETVAASHTTPESLEVNALLARMVERGCTAAAMEVSSHALSQHRVDSLRFQAAVFTNLTQDHLDYHGTMESYFHAKKALFDMLGTDGVAVTNLDDPYGKTIVENVRSRIVTYGSTRQADVHASNIQLTIRGVRCTVETAGGQGTISSTLTGRFNISNLLAAYATGIGLGIPAREITQGIQAVEAVAGRFQQIPSPSGWTAIVDYAHTPDALEKCLRAIHEIQAPGGKGRVITVFGCGGNRDVGKRPLMGRIASQMSDVVIVTSDNPRREDPQAIIDQVVAGVVGNVQLHTEVDRRRAILQGLELAQAGDIVLVAGKGHETSQVIGETRAHFDDREEIRNYIGAAA